MYYLSNYTRQGFPGSCLRRYYSPENDRGIAFDDIDLGIDWRIPEEKLNLSDKDTKQPKLTETNDLFEYGVNYYA